MNFTRTTELADPREKTLSIITLVFGCLFWIALIVCSFGIVIGVCIAGFILRLIAHSLLIAHMRGNGVEISARQFPDLYRQLQECCKTLRISKVPQAYLLEGHGSINAFATRFLREEFVVLNTQAVDAMADHPDGIAFYLGHELGHLRMRHLPKQFLRWPASWLPLLGAAYSRVKEATCDRHGRACCTTAAGAAHALSALAAGAHQWRTLDLDAYCDQSRFSGGFWMSLHELFSPYPWLTRRVVRVLGLERNLPRRHPLAFIIAALIPHAGRGGVLASLFIYSYLAFVGAMLGMALWTAHLKNNTPFTIPHAIQALKTPRIDTPPETDTGSERETMPRQNQVLLAFHESAAARTAIASYWFTHHRTQPPSMDAIGIMSRLPNGDEIRPGSGPLPTLVIKTHGGSILIKPVRTADGHIGWACRPIDSYTMADMPAACR